MAKELSFAEKVAKVRELANCGMTNEQIAGWFGLDEKDFALQLIEHRAIDDALRQGRAEGIEAAAVALRGQIEAGNPGSTKFFLQAKAGWRTNDLEDGLAVVSTTINLNKVNVLVLAQDLLAKGVPEVEWPSEVKALYASQSLLESDAAKK